MLASLKLAAKRRAEAWLFRSRDKHFLDNEPGVAYLSQRRVYIVPTKPGLAFALLLAILFTGSINYNLGLGFALTFFTACCAVVDMFLTARNLARLHLAAGRAPAVFAGEEVVFELLLLNRTRLDRYAIALDFLDAGAPRHTADVAAGGSSAVLLSCAGGPRGWLVAPRVRLVTRFPLGLFRAWSYWLPDARVLVYPFPEPVAPPLPLAGAPRETGGGGHPGHDDFAGIRSYQPGDPMRHLAWRQIARLDPAAGGQLVTKHFEAGAPAELCLDFAALSPHLDLETRLSRLARWVIEAERQQLAYAFHLGPLRFGAALGEAHRAACLEALALYGHDGQADGAGGRP